MFSKINVVFCFCCVGKRENYVDKEGEAKKLALTEGCQIYGYLEVNRVSTISTYGKKEQHSLITLITDCVIGFFSFVDGWQFSYRSRQKFLPQSYSHS